MSGNPEPYVAVALQPSFKGVKHRREIPRNLENIAAQMGAAMWLSAELPVKLVALPEASLQGFDDEIEDRRQSDYVENVAIDIPGPETEALGRLARKYDTYLIAQAKGKDPNIPGYFFNFAFILSPEGEVIHRAAKNVVGVIEGSCTPHDVWDRWVEVYGNTIDAFFPVCETPIGRIGTMICYEGFFPETARGLAMNGAEIIYHPSAAVNSVDMGAFDLANRARALDNNCYLVAPNSGLYHYSEAMHGPLDVTGGHSMIVDYRGQVIAQHLPNTNAWAAAVIDIGALRHFRAHSTMRNWMKEIKTEVFRTIYERPIYEKNFYLDAPDKARADRINWGQAGAERVASPRATERTAR